MLYFACVNVGDYEGRGWEYVSVLADMVQRNMPKNISYQFVCLTDKPEDVPAGVQGWRVEPGIKGWWNKLQLFRPHAFPNGSRVIYFDLDTVLIDDISALATYTGGFAALTDFYRPLGIGSGVMLWKAGDYDFIWEYWDAADRPEMDGGDQTWIETLIADTVRIQGQFPGMFASYKRDSKEGPPAGAAVIVFHGRPRPHEVHDDWVEKVWRIGGQTMANVNVQPNTSLEAIFKNVKKNAALPLPWVRYDRQDPSLRAIIVGGGPSLGDHLEEIKALHEEAGAFIFALNRAAQYLSKNGIEPDFQVIMDPRAENVQFASPSSARMHLIASTVHPNVVKRLREGKAKVRLFHPSIDGIVEALPVARRGEYAPIGGGTTVGVTSVALAFALGFRRMFCFGFDSSKANGRLHTYDQKLTDGEAKEIEVMLYGQLFVTTPTMLAQVRAFIAQASLLEKEGCHIEVMGEGLLPSISKGIEVKNGKQKLGGFWWPQSDKEAAPAILADAYAAIPIALEYVPDCRVAIQAGGNVGVYPKRLAEHFNCVVTFEPDEANYECLVENVPDNKVMKINAALGEYANLVNLVNHPTNVGAHYIDGNGAVGMTSIDIVFRAHPMNYCDLIWLDIEGYELMALRGATTTIDKYHPVIVVEDNGLSKRYGVPEGEVLRWLGERGYHIEKQIGRDLILVHG